MNILAPYRYGVAAPPEALELEFDGTDDYVATDDIIPFDLEYNTAFSHSFWMKTSTTGTAMALVSKQDGPPNEKGYHIGVNTSGYIFVTAVNKTADRIEIYGNVDVTTNAWVHVVVTHDGTSTAAGYTIYTDDTVNTKTVTLDALTKTIITTNPVNFGQRPGGPDLLYTGRLDDIRIYSNALSGAVVSYIYTDRNGDAIPASRVAQWKFDEGTADGAASGAGSIIDSGASGYDATPTGSPTYRTES